MAELATIVVKPHSILRLCSPLVSVSQRLFLSENKESKDANQTLLLKETILQGGISWLFHYHLYPTLKMHWNHTLTPAQ
jgi:hypothetical protein